MFSESRFRDGRPGDRTRRSVVPTSPRRPSASRPAFAAPAAIALLTVAASSFVAFAGPASAAAEPSLRVEEEIVVSANLVETPADEVGSSVTVILAEDIERHRWRTVAEALRHVPGLAVARTGGPGQSTSVFLRGGSSSQTLVLLDGVRINSATSGAFDFADLTTDHVERIEVVRGPQSTLYGSEAVGGVVSIITRSGGTGLRASGVAEGGEDGHRRLALEVGGGDDRFDWSFSVADLETDGISAADVRRGNTEEDRHENTTISGRLGWGFGEDARADLVLRHVDGEAEIDGFSFFDGPVDDLDATNSRDAATAGLTVTAPLAEGWRGVFTAGWNDDELEGADPTNPFGNFTVESQGIQFGARADVDLAADSNSPNVLSVGVAWEERQGGSVGSFDETVDIASFYVQDRLSLGEGTSLTLGARYDDHSSFGSETTWRVSGSTEVGSGGRFHGSWGTGFKAPTLNDLFFPGFGNPDLVPETSQAVDLGYEQTLADGRLVLDVTYFDADYEDLIVFDFSTFLPGNIAEASSRGVEASLAFDTERVNVALSHTWNETEDLSTGEPLARRPEHRSVLELSVQATDALRTALSAISSADRIDSDGTELEDYVRVDLTAQYEISEHFEPYVRVLNVFDEEYSEVGGFGSRGRTALFGVAFDY
ncbi:MAG: TonB-dependent receptor [Acidobacteriota bacterium]